MLANVFKYPFFRFGAQYTLGTGNTLLEGYRQKGLIYLWVFFLLNVFATVINTAAVGLLCAAILNFMFPQIAPSLASFSVIVVCTAILLLGHYRVLYS